MDQAEKGRVFRGLHERQKLFVIPNPWDAGSAKILASMGFEALTTAPALEPRSNWGGRMARGWCRATRRSPMRPWWPGRHRSARRGRSREWLWPLPRGCGRDDPAGGRGRAGGWVDRGCDGRSGQSDLLISTWRWSACRRLCEAARKLDFDFTFVARARISRMGGGFRRHAEAAAGLREGRRRRAVRARPAGARCHPHGLRGAQKPVNVVQGFKGGMFTLAELEEAGVRACRWAARSSGRR